MSKIRLIVGLGNYEDKYLQDRHNVGFMLVDEFFNNLPNKSSLNWQNKFNGHITIFDNPYQDSSLVEKIILLKPWSFMNLSGQPVQAVMSYYKIPPENVIVVHDELDLDPGRLKLKFAGGTAGHNGLKSISQAIGVNYWRIRIGIGHPGSREQVASYVLSKPSKDELCLFDATFQLLLKNQESIMTADLNSIQL
jgi:PTH1 family peptidyl-tRNA hydrolase